MNRLVITGSNGLVATELIHLLLASGGYRIYAVTTNIEKLSKRYATYPDIVCTSLDGLQDVIDGEIDAVVHCAFARNADGEDYASSLRFTHAIAQFAAVNEARLFINISSQSIYGRKRPPLWTEDTPPAPDYLYAMAKYGAEIIIDAVFANSSTNYTNIRLASVCENARFMNVFVKNALSGDPIKIRGGNQLCSFIDVRDVAEALKRVIEFEENLKHHYNLGIGKCATILELAQMVRDESLDRHGLDVEIIVEEADIKMEIGMDNSLFCETFNWHPRFTYKDMILALYALNLNTLGGVTMPQSLF